MNRLPNELRLRRLGVDTYHERVAFMRADCPVCAAEGFRAMSRIRIQFGARQVIATLNVVSGDLLRDCELGLSDAAWQALGAHENELATVSHPEPIDSFSAVRNKIYGGAYSDGELEQIIFDIAGGRYSAIETAAFITACAGDHMSLDETLDLTRAMVNVGTRLSWPQHPILDKHCVGGLPGNRTTPIVVAIVAACGLTIPKTSSKAITSPSGTADTMAMLAPVDLTLDHMRRVVESEGGCVVWGGAMALSPADDILIQIERPLDFDSESQLAASIISKKLAAGATHLLIDMPIGPTAKVRSASAATALGKRLTAVGTALGLHMRTIETDGRQPVGRGIGPALEARDVLAVLQGAADAPLDLRDRALLLAGHLLELGGAAEAGNGVDLAQRTLTVGAAWRKFQAICAAQGGMREPGNGTHRHVIEAPWAGTVSEMDNRKLSRLAKLAGAPAVAAAGVELHVRLNHAVERGAPLCTIHALSPGELEYALRYAREHPDLIEVQRLP